GRDGAHALDGRRRAGGRGGDPAPRPHAPGQVPGARSRARQPGIGDRARVGDRRSTHRARRGKPDDDPDATSAADAATSAADVAASADDLAASPADEAAASPAADAAASPPDDAAATSADHAAATPADDGSAAPAHDRPGAPDDHPAGAPADDLAAPHHDPTGAPVSAAAHTDDHAGSAESHPDRRAHRCARGAPDERTARGPGRPPADAAA